MHKSDCAEELLIVKKYICLLYYGKLKSNSSYYYFSVFELISYQLKNTDHSQPKTGTNWSEPKGVSQESDIQRDHDSSEGDRTLLDRFESQGDSSGLDDSGGSDSGVDEVFVKCRESSESLQSKPGTETPGTTAGQPVPQALDPPFSQ